jgi:mRNA interferase RelE/StbE
MKIRAYQRFGRAYRELPEGIQKRLDKQIRLLAEDMRHPSLHTKKIKGKEGVWEARVDIHHRFTFEIVGDTVFLRAVGNHDEVLKSP